MKNIIKNNIINYSIICKQVLFGDTKFLVIESMSIWNNEGNSFTWVKYHLDWYTYSIRCFLNWNQTQIEHIKVWDFYKLIEELENECPWLAYMVNYFNNLFTYHVDFFLDMLIVKKEYEYMFFENGKFSGKANGKYIIWYIK